jgi:hypothetical protein
MPYFNDSDATLDQVLRSVGIQTPIKHQAIMAAIEGFMRLIAPDCDW